MICGVDTVWTRDVFMSVGSQMLTTSCNITNNHSSAEFASASLDLWHLTATSADNLGLNE